MSTFGGIYFTNKGRDLFSKAQTGVNLKFTRIAVGNGSLNGQTAANLNGLINEVKSLQITKLKTMQGGKIAVGGIFTNQDISSGFWWRELGLFADDPDCGEILYCYGNAAELGEFIPSPGGADILEKQITIVTLIENASDISAVIDSSMVYVTRDEFDVLESIVGDGVLQTTSKNLSSAVNELNNNLKLTVSASVPGMIRASDLWFKII